MAWRFRQRYSETGDAVLPEDWLVSQNEFASEFNGYLDRDNFGDGAFSTNSAWNDLLPVVKDNTFNRVFVRQRSTESGGTYGQENLLDADIKSTGYRSKAFEINSSKQTTTTQSSVASISLTEDNGKILKTPALLICEFSCMWAWMNKDTKKFLHDDTEVEVVDASLIERDQLTPDNLAVTRFGTDKLDACIRWRITVNGRQISESGWISNARRCANTYLVGAIPVEAGAHTIQAEYRIAYVDRFNEFNEAGNVKRYCEIWDRELIVHARKR